MAGGDLKALRDRLRAASGPDKELGHALATWLAGNTAPDEWPAIAMLPYYAMGNGIEAVGAALALCERTLPGWGFKCECNLGFGIEVTLGHVGPDKFYDRPQGFGTGPTLPLAILLALLEAMIGKETGDA